MSIGEWWDSLWNISKEEEKIIQDVERNLKLVDSFSAENRKLTLQLVELWYEFVKMENQFLNMWVEDGNRIAELEAKLAQKTTVKKKVIQKTKIKKR